MVLAGSCHADGTCKISEHFYDGCLTCHSFTLEASFSTHCLVSQWLCKRGSVEHPAHKIYLKLNYLFSVLVVSCELTIPVMLMVVNISHVTLSSSAIS